MAIMTSDAPELTYTVRAAQHAALMAVLRELSEQQAFAVLQALDLCPWGCEFRRDPDDILHDDGSRVCIDCGKHIGGSQR